MTEELQKALTEVLNGVLTAKDFMLAELPEVIQQLLLWKFWMYFIYNIMGWVVVIGSVPMTIKLWKLGKAWYDKERESRNYPEPLHIFSLVTILLWIPALISGVNLVWLQIWIAPKVYLIEYAASLAK